MISKCPSYGGGGQKKNKWGWMLVHYLFFDLQARATSEIAVADLSDSENR